MYSESRKANAAEQAAYDYVAKNSLRPENISTYGWADVDGKFQLNEYGGCHSQIMQHNLGTRLGAFFSAVKGFNRCSAEQLELLEWLLDPAVSPYREALPKQSIIVADGTDITSVEYVRQKGFIQSDLTVPANIAVGLWITAGRAMHEYPQYAVNPWVALRKEGVHPQVAYLFRGLSNGDARGKRSPEPPFYCKIYGYHGENLPTYLLKTQAENFMLNRVEYRNDPIGKSKTYLDTSRMWGTRVQDVPGAVTYTAQQKWEHSQGFDGSYATFLLETYPEHMSVKNALPSAGANQRYYYTHVQFNNRASWIEVAKREQERLGLKDDWHPTRRQTSSAGGKAAAHVEPDARNPGAVPKRDNFGVYRDEFGRFASNPIQL